MYVYLYIYTYKDYNICKDHKIMNKTIFFFARASHV